MKRHMRLAALCYYLSADPVADPEILESESGGRQLYQPWSYVIANAYNELYAFYWGAY